MIEVAIGIQNVPDIMSYLEMYITIPVTLNGKNGVFIPILYLDKTAPIVAGREWIGFPKVDGELKYLVESNRITASVKRRNKILLECSASTNTPLPDAMQNEVSYGFVFKEIPSSVGSPIPETKQINSYVFSNTRVSGLEPCSYVKLKWRSSPDNFMPEILILEVVRAGRTTLDVTLDYGAVEYNYLDK